MSKKIWIGLAVVLVVVVAGAAALFLTRPNNQANVPPLTQTFGDSPSGFTFRYPEDWRPFIPMQGLMVAGPPDTLNGATPGPSFTIQRAGPVSVYDSLDAAFNDYLTKGALSPQRQWHKLSEITHLTLQGRDTLVVDLQGLENAASPEQRARIYATTSQNTFVYYIILSAPVATWETDEPLLTAVMNSFQILE